jgi:hypothetical protein
MNERRNITRGMSQRWNMLFLLFTMFLACLDCMAHAQSQQDPFAINGGSILAMAGKESVAVAVDKRFGSGPQVGCHWDMSCGRPLSCFFLIYRFFVFFVYLHGYACRW